MQPATDAEVIAGFVAAEGCFTHGDAKTFRFVVALGATDGDMCVVLQRFFGVGHVYWRRRRKPHYDDEVTYAVRAFKDLVEVIVPFMDDHLPPCHKRTQYEAWRADLVEY